MAGKGSEKTQFKKGISGNPKGKPKYPDDLKAARSEYQADLEAMIFKHQGSSLQSLKDKFQDPNTSVKELMIIKLMIKALELADYQRFDFLLNRTIGKVKEQIDHTVTTKPSILVKTDGTEIHFVNGNKVGKL